MKNLRSLLVFMVLLLVSPAWAVERYVSLSGSDINSCAASESIETPKRTFASAIACINAGDTMIVRGGLWTEHMNFQAGNKSGTANAWITVKGYPGETVTIRYDGTTQQSYGPIQVRGNRGYFVFENLILDGTDEELGSNWEIRDGNHHFTLRNIEIKNFLASGLNAGHGANDILVDNCWIHDQRNAAPSRAYGIYFEGDNLTIQNSDISYNPGGGITIFPRGHNIVIRNNLVHHNNFMDSPNPAIQVYEDVDYYGGTAEIDGVYIYGNVVYENNLLSLHPDPGGIQVSNGAANVRVWNNTIYGNKGWGMNVQSSFNGPPVNTTVQNNIITGNTSGQYVNAGTNTVVGYNACLAGDACGSTGKVTLSSTTQCFVNAAGDDYRLKQGTNPCRNAGTTVSTIPSSVGTPDIGAYEQGKLVSAVVVGGVIEATADVMTPAIVPTTGISGLSITCITCTGTPVVTGILKPGSTSVLQLNISGLATSGTCSLNLGSTNAKDSGYVGPSSLSLSQGLDSVTGLSVSGTCVNTSGVVVGSEYSRLLLEEGSGTVANDTSGNAHHGTVSAGVTWVTGADGGVTIPTDATYRHIDTGYGSGINPTSQSFAQCTYVQLDLAQVPTVVGSSTNGVDQRAYIGVQNVGGQPQWGIGVQTSGFGTGSEFVATATPTFVCLLFDSSTDTAKLRVGKTTGTISGKSIKGYTSYLLANNLRVGNDGVNTVNNGGFTVFGIWTWNTLPSDAELDALYDSLSPGGTPVPCYTQDAHKWERVFTDGSNPLPIGLQDAAISVVDGGGVALNIQITCTGTAGGPVAYKFFYSSDGVTYNEIPAVLGAGGIAMWGNDESFGLNHGATTGRISGSLTPTSGITLVSSSVSPTVSLVSNSAYEIRLLLRLATGLAGQYRLILVKQDNGLSLANAPTIGPARIDIVNPRGGGMF